MSNPLYNQYGNQQNNGNIFQRLSQFKNAFRGNGADAQAQIQEMLNSGQLSQADYNNAVQRANQIASLFGMK